MYIASSFFPLRGFLITVAVCVSVAAVTCWQIQFIKIWSWNTSGMFAQNYHLKDSLLKSLQMVLLGFEFIPYNCVFGDFDLLFLVF